MDPLVCLVRQAFIDQQLAARGERIVVAVSGGLDSVVLLHILQTLAPEFGWQLTIAHLDHGLRGRSSKDDARFVRRLATSCELEYQVGEANIRRQSSRNGESVEMAARRVRHAFLARVARSVRAKRVALAHHADDQVELFFLRLFRGSSSAGLGGMNWSNPSSAHPAVQLIRPLLGCTRRELESYRTRFELPFREDATNADLGILRNRIRHELMPFLQRRYSAALPGIVARTMKVLGTDAEFILAEARRFQKRGPTRRFSRVHPAVQRMVVSLGLRRLGIEADFQLIEALCRDEEVPIAVAPQTTTRRRRDGTVTLHREPVRTRTEVRRRIKLAPLPHRLRLGVLELKWRFRRTPARFPNPIGQEQLDAGQVGDTICLRQWRAGDRFRPLGLPKSTKLQDLFTNRKVPANLRPSLLLATTESGEIFWVEGLPPGDAFKITSTTRRVLVWSAHRMDDTVGPDVGESGKSPLGASRRG